MPHNLDSSDLEDVYKRQFIGRSIRFQNHQRFIVIVILYRLEFAIGVLGSVGRIILCTGLITPPVSYTHLDVYKRQAY